MSEIFPTSGRSKFLESFLNQEVHFEFGSGTTPLTDDSESVDSPLMRKRVFVKGFAKNFADRPRATIGYIADAGQPGSAQINMAYYLQDCPSLLYAGDLSYIGLNSQNIIDALAAFSQWTSDQSLYPAFGNHDQDHVNGLDNMLAFFSYLDGARYYNFELGIDGNPGAAKPVHVTCYNSGLNSLGELIEPDGTDSVSTQATTLKAAANAATNPWKICVVHHPPVTGRASFVAELAHLLDGTWDLVLCGHSHVCEEIDCNGITRVLNVSSVKENRGSGALQGAVGPGVAKLWSNDTARAGVKLYATDTVLAWDVIDHTNGNVVHQSHIRKPAAPRIFTSGDKRRFYITPDPSNTLLLNAVIAPGDLADATPIKQLGVFVGAAGEIISPGADTVEMDEVSETGTAVLFDDGLNLTHSVTTAKSITRVIEV